MGLALWSYAVHPAEPEPTQGLSQQWTWRAGEPVGPRREGGREAGWRANSKAGVCGGGGGRKDSADLPVFMGCPLSSQPCLGEARPCLQGMVSFSVRHTDPGEAARGPHVPRGGVLRPATTSSPDSCQSPGWGGVRAALPVACGPLRAEADSLTSESRRPGEVNKG